MPFACRLELILSVHNNKSITLRTSDDLIKSGNKTFEANAALVLLETYKLVFDIN